MSPAKGKNTREGGEELLIRDGKRQKSKVERDKMPYAEATNDTERNRVPTRSSGWFVYFLRAGGNYARGAGPTLYIPFDRDATEPARV